MTKSDVLSSFESIKVAVAYRVNGVETDRIPYDINSPIEPVYKEFKGWMCDISGFKSADDLPEELLAYIQFVEHETVSLLGLFPLAPVGTKPLLGSKGKG
jgi:adenylosuccinate synthase